MRGCTPVPVVPEFPAVAVLQMIIGQVSKCSMRGRVSYDGSWKDGGDGGEWRR